MAPRPRSGTGRHCRHRDRDRYGRSRAPSTARLRAIHLRTRRSRLGSDRHPCRTRPGSNPRGPRPSPRSSRSTNGRSVRPSRRCLRSGGRASRLQEPTGRRMPRGRTIPAVQAAAIACPRARGPILAVMSVYLDDWRQSATIRSMTSRWSHLTADTTQELHLFARRLGIPARAFQQKPGKPQFDHYDVPDELRELAISLGAIALTWREAATMRRRRRLGLTASEPAEVPPPGRSADARRSPG